jgi:hypothetical protein
MMKLLFAVLIFVFYACNSDKGKPADGDNTLSSLERRLDIYMKLNDEMKMDSLMDYIYPKLFEYVPRAELVKTMNDGFKSGDRVVEIDSMHVEKIHPLFEMDGATYAKVDYSMVMNMQFRKRVTNAEDSVDQGPLMDTMFAEKYGRENVIFNKELNRLRIRMKSSMVAINDKYAEDWSFVNLSMDSPLSNKLFSDAVLKKLETYK